MLRSLKRFARRCRDWWHAEQSAALLHTEQRLIVELGLTRDRQLQRMEELADRLVDRLGAFREAPAPTPPPPVPEQPRLTADDRKRLDDQGLFIYGCARSGTTALFDAMNSSPDVYLLSEGNLYQEAARRDFRQFQWMKQVGYHFARGKGLFPPIFHNDDLNGFELLAELSKRYRFVGDKLATGPWIFNYGFDDLDRLLAFQATHFYNSNYVVIVRHPAEIIKSMRGLFPGFSDPQYLAVWAHSLRVALQFYATFPKVYFLSFDNLNAGSVVRLADRIGFQLEREPVWLAPTSQRSSGARYQYIVSGECQAALRSAIEIYEDLCRSFDRESFRFCGNDFVRVYVQGIYERLAPIADGTFAEVQTERAAG